MRSRIQTRRRSRIGARISSISQTFTRSGPAYLNGVEVPANTPRFPSQSGIVGVLPEEASTNLALHSAAFDNAYWTKTNATVTANAATAPDGTLAMDKLVESATTAEHYIILNGIGTALSPEAVSVYAKAGERSWLCVNVGGVKAWFNLATGALGVVGAGTATITPIGGGVYRCSMAVTSLGGTYVALAPDTGNGANASDNTSYAGDGTSGLYLWGIQVEAKAYPTSYIPTTTATATRNAETLTVPTAGLLAPSQGSVTTEVYISRLTGTPSRYLFRVPDSGGTDELYVGIVNNKWQAKAGSAAAAASAASATTGAHYAVLVWSGSTWDVYVDGVLVLSGTGNTPFAAFGATGYIGSDGTAKHINDGIRRQYYHDYRMSPAQAVAASLGSVPPDFTAYLNFTNGKLESLQGHPYQPAEVLSLFMDARQR